MGYGIEVRIIEKTTGGGTVEHWRRVRPTVGQPYIWPTLAEASSMRRMCYPEETSDNVRIVEVQE